MEQHFSVERDRHLAQVFRAFFVARFVSLSSFIFHSWEKVITGGWTKAVQPLFYFFEVILHISPLRFAIYVGGTWQS